MSQGIRIHVVASMQDFSNDRQAAERAAELAKAGVLIQMEFIGECNEQKIEGLRRKLREANGELDAANLKLRQATRKPRKPKAKVPKTK